MKSKIKVFASILAISALTVLNVSAQHSNDYAYQNSKSSTYNRDDRYPTYQNRTYYAASPELQRLYLLEDVLRRRINEDLRFGDRREARRDQEKLEDVQRHILREESLYARNNRDYRSYDRDHHDSDRDRRADYDRDRHNESDRDNRDNRSNSDRNGDRRNK
jgi:hypothetical protein